MSELENHGATARDHLANERTFLAWVRTGLGVVGLGVVLERISAGQDIAALVGGLALIAYGAAMLIYAMTRYRRVGEALEAGRFPVARRGPMVIGALSLLIVAVAVAVVLR